MLVVVKKHNSWQKMEGFTGIIKIIINSMYDNVVDDDLAHKDILYFMDGVVRLVIQARQHNFHKDNFDDQGLAY